jgi:hypothetical protein
MCGLLLKFRLVMCNVLHNYVARHIHDASLVAEAVITQLKT